MKQGKKLTRKQKEDLAANNLEPDDYVCVANNQESFIVLKKNASKSDQTVEIFYR